ncbi:MAG TPA: AbrB/MazE/SpoVT family DNA-binding domain-containing protein [Terriglobales bacterium]|nr:AbrB/MazE/SpoVT family DNA-binding domain-containing protein [Terriglobales bacterium]
MAWYNAIMVARLTIDKAGRVVLPKPVRDELQLAPGDSLELESSDQQIVLRPVRGTLALQKEHGVWVFCAGEPLSASTVKDTLREVRQERDRANVGRKR